MEGKEIKLIKASIIEAFSAVVLPFWCSPYLLWNVKLDYSRDSSLYPPSLV
jgi:hypothetical protein